METLWITNLADGFETFNEAERTFFEYIPGSDTRGYDIWTDERKQAWEQEYLPDSSSV